MFEYTARTNKLIGDEGTARLASAKVLIVGVGGVGGMAFEMLARAGVGCITVVDGDVFEESNLNRQILSQISVIGKPKAEIAALRAKEVAPDCKVEPLYMRYSSDTADKISVENYDYVADCIDSVTDKTDLIVRSMQSGVPIISAMGSGNRLYPNFVITDIYSTSGDGLARVMRKKLREAGIKKISVVCDTSMPMQIEGVPGTVSYAPNISGCLIAQKIITDLLCKE